jgi:FAD/FMN-containing dehydrogenase
VQKGEIASFRGPVVWPDDPTYDERRRVWNAMHDRRPALIACCSSVADVAAAVCYGRERELPIAVRCGGHSMPGHSVCDGGIVIDLRALNGVAVDAQARRASVRGGALLGEVDRATQEHGLVVPAGVVSHTGIGGLTLGGGVGRLMRRFGLTIDSLISAELVTAAGEVLRANVKELPDLFWALRGGGGNFGIVTEFEFALHDLSEIVMLASFHPLQEARAVLEQAAHVMAAQPPDELLWTSFLRRAPDLPWVPPAVVGDLGIVSAIEWSGRPDDGHELLGGIRASLPPGPSSLATIPFLAAQSAGDEIFAAGKLTYIKAGFVDRLSDGLIDALIEAAAGIGSPFSQIEVLAVGGAISRVEPEATAFPHRDAAWLINVPATWESPTDSDAEVAWARQSYARIRQHLSPGTYVNFMDEDENAGADSAYGRTLERLQAVKAIYDPDNVFRPNQNIQPVALSSP